MNRIAELQEKFKKYDTGEYEDSPLTYPRPVQEAIPARDMSCLEKIEIAFKARGTATRSSWRCMIKRWFLRPLPDAGGPRVDGRFPSPSLWPPMTWPSSAASGNPFPDLNPQSFRDKINDRCRS